MKGTKKSRETFVPLYNNSVIFLRKDVRCSWNRYSVEIPLSVALIVRVHIRRGAECDEPPLDSTGTRQAGDFFAGTKSARRNLWQDLGGRERKKESLGLAFNG